MAHCGFLAINFPVNSTVPGQYWARTVLHTGPVLGRYHTVLYGTGPVLFVLYSTVRYRMVPAWYRPGTVCTVQSRYRAYGIPHKRLKCPLKFPFFNVTADHFHRSYLQDNITKIYSFEFENKCSFSQK